MFDVLPSLQGILHTVFDVRRSLETSHESVLDESVQLHMRFGAAGESPRNGVENNLGGAM
jgi:hypothetical protein